MAHRLVKMVTPDTGIGVGTKVFDVESGREIPGITSVEVPRFGPEDPIRLNLELFADHLNITGAPRFFIADPKTGNRREVKSITFADGETVEF
ncbi:hypothetical protein [Mesorhizobium sp. M1B.F.Ca.ET.045.04.1.1]|uniref:hypothetical protein n=1 Tax=Mesorhizobium sp. M1B.F.Ca.ET.045.04.1.1 TaxID=2493673 RepID=UPI000F758EA4|nr:hypothetical protein [Mesorhizobium sp. M1B.F.Ca.ET.045.04.1.1]AZO29403.1 hypothetical protein EJ071_19760 [Mesorhizobium sp. M1B.F.Ca.ET.045.04.1.1]